MPWEALAFCLTLFAVPFIIAGCYIRLTADKPRKITISTGNSEMFTIPARRKGE